MRKCVRGLLLAGFVAVPVSAQAATPTLDDVLKASGVSVSGYLDTSYNYLTTDGVFTSGTASRVFDSQPNAFTLNQLAVTIAKQPSEGVGAVVNLTMGTDADVISSAGSLSGENFDVTQAFIQYATGSLTLMGGKFVTLSGAEVINTTANANLSRSILFGYAIPFSHTGVRAAYKAGDMVTLYGGINNGWDQLTDANRQKTVELGVAVAPTSAISLSAVLYTGSEPSPISAITGRRDLVDLVASFQATDALAFVLNYDYAKQEDGMAVGKDAKWSGLAGYANFKIDDKCRLSLRGEYFDDEDSFKTGVIQKWKEVSLTFGHAASAKLDLLAEVRYDTSDKDSFSDANGTKVKDNQQSLGLKAVYKF